MRRAARRLAALACAALAGCAQAQPGGTTLAAYLAQPQPEPQHTVRYGPQPVQAVDVFVPTGAGPHPVAVLVHGGCWSAALPGREQLRPLAAALAARGVAVWSIGYRRVQEPGGGYPGTFQDVATALDRLAADGPALGLDPQRSVLAGHSAGGHLALWAAARAQLLAASPLRTPGPPWLPRRVLGIAAIADLRGYLQHGPGSCSAAIPRLQPAGAAGDAAWADTDPRALAAAGQPPVWLLSGSHDTLVPPAQAERYREVASGATLRTLQANHFDLVTPRSPAGAQVVDAVLELLAD